MTTGPEASLRLIRCGARTEITASQRATLRAVPDPVEPVSPRLFCELADGHQDAHVALAVASHGDVPWWWLRWGWRQEVVEIDLCDVTESDGPYPEFCLFPAGHPGSHSFDVRPWSARETAGPDTAPVGRHLRIVGD